MNILILGSTGFIGNAIFNSLVKDHNVTIAGKRPVEGYDKWKAVDFLKSNDWDTLLDGIDLTINAIGILEGDFKRLQTDAPLELYRKCINKKIRIIHISAIGAEKEKPITPFLSSKKIVDDFLIEYDKAKVVYPGVVIGRQGKSTQFLAEIARLPIVPLFSAKPIPFVHINQLTDLIYRIVTDFDKYPGQVFAVSKPEPMENIFSALKGKKGRFIDVPERLFRIIFSFFPNFSIGIFNKATFSMLKNSSVSDYEPLFPEVSKKIDSDHIKSGDALPFAFAIFAISFIWIWSGVSSLISWTDSYGLMKEIGASHILSVLLIWLGSIGDIFLGMAVFSRKYRKSIIILQVLIMLTYMLILSTGAPHYWLHPFGVIAKNIPLVALSYYVYKRPE